jgi:hypothetical protein
MRSWNIESTPEFDDWAEALEEAEQDRLDALIEVLAEKGPGLGRPLVDTVKGSKHANMKELRRGTTRVLFAFDPNRTAVLLVGGDKRGGWRTWYVKAIKRADRLFDRHLRELSD